MKQTWLTSRGGRAGNIRLQGGKKRLAKCQELNDIVASLVSEVLKQNKCSNSETTHELGSEDESENFDFEILVVG